MTLPLLQQALRSRPHHLSPFLVLGDPTPALSVELAQMAVAAGATMLELGLPFSDPCADGPAIAAACRRALQGGSSTAAGFAALARIAATCPAVPRNLLVYGNLVHAAGIAAFCRAAAAAGASSLLVPDMPLGEDEELHAACAAAGLGHVRLVAPASLPARIAASGDGAAMLYVAALQGVTGADSRAETAAAVLARARAAAPTPLCLGFGLASAAAVRSAFAAGAAVAVVGSHLARAIGGAAERGPAAVRAAFAAALAEVIASPSPSSTGERSCS
jgi:tryptophan synthase alpha chain